MAAGALSARGVAGELDGHVPNYNIFGQQHHSHPTRDKAHFAKIAKEKPEWTRTPRYRTRSEMFSARRAAKHPDLSYDLDGDGAVGSTDYFIGKQFSSEKDHRLNTAERQNAVTALENGFLDNFSFGHDHFGAKRPYPIKQIRGKIISADNIGDLSQVYPPHWNADKVGRFKTTSEMVLHRKTECQNAAAKLKTDWEAKFPDVVVEPPVPQSPRHPLGMSKGSVRDSRRREAREYAGLDPEISYVNPSRELQAGTTLDYIEEPANKSRLMMREGRKREMREEARLNRLLGETTYVPGHIRHAAKECNEYEERRGNPNCSTLTKLKHQRKVEKIEHNMANFQARPVGTLDKQVPRFGEQEDAWWALQPGYIKEPAPCILRALIDPEKEVSRKVTEISFPVSVPVAASVASSVRDRPPSTTEVDPACSQSEHKTLHRWTTEFVPQRGLDNKAPRFFDGVKQAATYSMDTAELDQFSSFDCIAKTSVMNLEVRQRKAAMEDEERAHSWKLSVRGLPDYNQTNDQLESDFAMEGFVSGSLTGPPSQQPFSSQEPGTLRGIEFRSGSLKTEPLAEPIGEDAPMTARLGRITSRQRGKQLDPVDEKSSVSPPPNLSRTSLGKSSPGAKSGTGTLGRSAQPNGLTVRTGGFQWVERQMQPTLPADTSNTSLQRAAPSEKYGSNTSMPLADKSPPQSRSVSRTQDKNTAKPSLG